MCNIYNSYVNDKKYEIKFWEKKSLLIMILIK